jgi:hypothetical protein
MCLVCEFVRDTSPDATCCAVQEATHTGYSLSFGDTVAVCEAHTDWITDDFPETLRRMR